MCTPIEALSGLDLDRGDAAGEAALPIKDPPVGADVLRLSS